MKNLSLDNEPILLTKNKNYIAIDALYIKEIKENFAVIDFENFKADIREKVFAFPYTDIPFAEFKANESTFTINSIKKVNYENLVDNKKVALSVDSGIILIIAECIFIDFIVKSNFDFCKLVDTENEVINSEYWGDITSLFPFDAIALISSSGDESNYDFKGSGTYKII